VKRGERQNDVTHYQFHRHAVEQPTHQRMLRQENQPAACPVVNSRRRGSDKEVQADTKNIGAGPSLQSLPPQQASGDHERNLRSKQDASLAKVQNAGDQATAADREWASGLPLPAGADAYVLSGVLHDWDDERALAILRRATTDVPGLASVPPRDRARCEPSSE